MTLPLDSFRRILGYNPWHFWGFDTSSIRPMTSKCNGLVMEYAWQDADIIGRSDMRREIQRAEQRLKNLLGYRPGPEFVEVTLPYPRLQDARMNRLVPVDASNRRLAVYAGEGMIRAVGKMTRVVIDPAAAVTYDDLDGDGLDETFTISAATALVSDPSEVAIYVPAAERVDDLSISERWRITPINVTIAGGVVTITGKAWIMARPILYEGLLAQAGIDPTDANNFLDEVELYRLYADPDGTTTDDSQAVLIWESMPIPRCASACCGFSTPTVSDPAAVGYAIARSGIRDARRGLLTPGESVWNTDGTWSDISWDACREPDRVILRFYAGAYLDSLDGPTVQPGLNIRFDEIITRLAIAGMTRRLCACEEANQEWYRWQFDLSRSAGVNDEQYSISPEDLNNPLGTRAGEVHAWKAIKNTALPSVAIA